MIKKRNPFLLFLASLIPGAGAMYLGFFRQGLSIMTVCAVVFAIGNLTLPQLIFLVPVIWFYSFFHSNNLNSLPDEDFYTIDDDYFLHINYLFRNNGALLKRHSRFIAVLLICFGGSMLWNSFSDLIHFVSYRVLHLPESVLDLLYYVTSGLPESVIAVAIIFLGIHMIKNKRDSLGSD